jgi:hypothetical protein
VYTFDFKIYHIAQHVTLPPAPVLGPGAAELPADQALPPLLIINMQLPTYPVRWRSGSFTSLFSQFCFLFIVVCAVPLPAPSAGCLPCWRGAARRFWGTARGGSRC